MKIISVLSAWGMFLVVLGHSSPPPAGDIWIPKIWVHLHELIYGFHMPLFAFISGVCFFLFSNYKSYMALILHKIRRLLVPYFFWMSFLFFLKALFSEFAKHPIPLDFQLLLHQWLYPKQAIVSYYWFLLVLFFIFLLYSIFQIAKKSMVKIWEAVITCIFLLLNLYNPWNDCYLLSINRVFDLLIYFWLGILAAKYCLCLSKIKYYVFGVILLCGVCLGKTGIWSDSIYRFVLAIVGIYVSWGGAFVYTKYDFNFLSCIEGKTYTIYLLHGVVQCLLAAVLIKFKIGFALYYPVMLIIGLMFPIMIFRAFEKYKIQNKFLNLIIGRKG